MSRPVICVKPKFHDETPEEQDELNLKYADSYCNLCIREHENARWEQRQKVPPEHLAIWNYEFPQIRNKEKASSALVLWHLAHIFLSGLYPLATRPAQWLEDLANEERRIKHKV